MTTTVAIVINIAFRRPVKRAAPRAKFGKVLKFALPLGILQPLSLCTGMIAYMHLGVAFIQMLKSTTVVLVMCLSYALGVDGKPSRALVISVIMIGSGVCGVFVSVYEESECSMFGVLMMGISVVAEAIRCVITQMMMTRLQCKKLDVLSTVGPLAVVGLLVAFYIFEREVAMQEGIGILQRRPLVFVASASLGFAVQFNRLWVTQTCSALTLQVSATLRNIIIVVCSAATGEHVDVPEMCGYAVSLSGVYMYSDAKAKVYVTKSKADRRSRDTLESLPSASALPRHSLRIV